MEELRVTNLLGGALAAITGAVVASFFGVFGTLAGAGVMSIFMAVATAGYVCAIYPRQQEQEVRLLFEFGVRLPDPERLLEGDGTQTRFIRVRQPDERLAAAIGRYVHEAVAERLFRR